MRDDEGAGSVLAVAVLAVAVLLVGSLVPLYIGVTARRALAGAADAAALAAADASSGAIPGFPCPLAEEVASTYSAALEQCAASEGTAVVTVSRSILGLPVQISARAGPPDRASAPTRTP